MLVKKQGLFEVGQQTASHMLDQYHEAIKFDIEAQIQSWQPVLRYEPIYRARSSKNVFSCILQKQEKPKFVLCVTFAENGDAITGDSSGNILVWGKGTLIHFVLFVCVPKKEVNSLLHGCYINKGQWKHKIWHLERHNFKNCTVSCCLTLIYLLYYHPVRPLICPPQAVDLYVQPNESHPISVTQALIVSATSSKELTRAASLLCACWGTARWCLEEKTAGSSPGTAATTKYRQWRWEEVQQNERGLFVEKQKCIGDI